MIERDPRSFNKPDQPVAVLLEGTFESYYKNKFLPDTIKNSKLIGYKTEGIKPSKIIVVGDGDVAKNLVYKGKSLPLGLDRMNRMNREFYANKTFLLNCMNYLLDDKGLLSVRSREVTLRLLDRGKIKDHRLKWQLINTIGPVVYVTFFGLLLFGLRRRKYVKNKPLPKWFAPLIFFFIALIPLTLFYAISDSAFLFFVKLIAGLIIVLIFRAGRWLSGSISNSRRSR
jgi:gliding-associated putative ABC transporter substrate-binding component GldG